MPRMVVTRTIDAPEETVFRIVSDIRRFSEAFPHIVKVEILSEVESGVGTRFRETRVVKGREVSTELEVTEFVENDRVRIVADSHGTVWDTVFTVVEKDGRTELTMTMDAKARGFLSKMTTPLVMGLVRKEVEADLDAVQAYCEERV